MASMAMAGVKGVKVLAAGLAAAVAAAVVRWVELLDGSDDGEEKVGERDDV